MYILFSLILSLLFLLPIQEEGIAPPSPTSSQWRYLLSSGEQEYYFLIKSRSYYTEIWFKNSDATDTTISLARYNCELGAERTLQITTFHGNELFRTSVYKDSEWRYPYPETVGAAMLRVACGERKREWTYIGGDEEDNAYFLKFDSLSRMGNVVRVWSQTSKGEVRKSVTLYQFDCVENKIRALQSTTYRGDEVHTSTGSEAWSYVVPNSIGEMLAKTACKATRPAPKRKIRNR